jgi:hypothetical protein
VLTNFLEMMTWNSGQHGVSRLTRLVRIKYRFFKFSAKQKGSSGCPATPPPTIKLELVRKSGQKEEVRISLEEEDTSLFYQPKPFICLPLLNVLHVNIYYLKMPFFSLINLSSRTQALIPTYPYFP